MSWANTAEADRVATQIEARLRECEALLSADQPNVCEALTRVTWAGGQVLDALPPSQRQTLSTAMQGAMLVADKAARGDLGACLIAFHQIAQPLRAIACTVRAAQHIASRRAS
ncbi:hypothetical protein JYT86_00840 [bacterium AH-315-N03]|nr:hypothetical protein [bacterium AH-315-N03]